MRAGRAEPTDGAGGLRPLMARDRPERTALVSAIGVAAADVPAILAATGRRLARFDRVVYLTDDADFRPYRAVRAIVEYVPPIEDMRRAPDLPWPAYLEAKRTLLLAKWRPGMEIAYGLSWADYVSRAAGGEPAAHQ